MRKETEYKIWMVRAGSGSFLIDEFLDEEVVAIGWNEIGKIPKNIEYDELKEMITEAYGEWSSGKLGQTSGQIWCFLYDFQKGDKVVTYDSNTRLYYLGEIISDYKFSKQLKYSHYRKIKWNDGAIERDMLTINSKNTLGSILTIFEVPIDVWNDLQESHPEYISDEELEHIEELQKEYEKHEEAELQSLKDNIISNSNEFIKDKVTQLTSEELEKLVAGILQGMGYKARLTSRGPDLGSDIIASPDGLEMVEPIIKAEVKHKKASKNKVTAPEIRNFVGGLRATTKGIYISSTGFSKDANYEAERANFQVTLVDLDRLVELLIEYYEELNPETKALVPLKKIYWPI